MDLDVIKSYLVSLGFEIEQPGLRNFQNTLKEVQVGVERVLFGTAGIAKRFVEAGTVITGALAGIATGTVLMMDRVAQADLGYQVFARRLFTTTETARSLKIATDALGYSLEDIIWGPPELRERYGQLIKDQALMTGGLGAGFETQMRQIRDIRFEFTRMGVELKYLSMGVVMSLSRALFGDETSLLSKLREFNDYLIKNLPNISDQIASKLAPILKDTGGVLKDLWDIVKQIDVKKLAGDIVWLADKLKALVDFINRSPILQKMILGAAVGAASPIPGGTAIGALGGALYGVVTGKDQYKRAIREAAKQYGIDPNLALAIAQQESGFNPKAVNAASGATGLFQLMPGTAKRLGVDPTDPNQNIMGAMSLLHDLLQKYHGNVRAALKDYGGFVTKDPTSYTNSILALRDQYSHIVNSQANPGLQRYLDASRPWSSAQPISMKTDIGGITVHVSQPNASADEIAQATAKAVDDTLAKRSLATMVQLNGSYA